MASITIGGSGPAAGTLEKAARRWVELMPALGGAWTPAPYWEPQEATEAALPGIGNASILYRFGTILREDRTSFERERPESISGSFVRIVVASRGGRRSALWHGVAASEKTSAGANGTGDRVVECLGLESILDRAAMRESYFLSGDSVRLNAVPQAFNRMGPSGRIVGNRTTSMASDGLSYLFRQHDEDSAPAVWTALNILEYALARFGGKSGVTWRVTGSAREALNSWEPVIHVENAPTVFGLMRTLLDRRRGLGAKVVWEGGTTAEVQVFSVSEVEKRGGIDWSTGRSSFVLAANRNVVDLDLRRNRKLIGVEAGSDEVMRYGRVVVRGARLRVTATFSYADGSLVAGWTAGEEVEYRAGASAIQGYAGQSDSVKGTLNDTRRRTDSTVSRVYSRFKVPQNFDWVLDEREIAEVATDLVAIANGYLPVNRTVPRAVLRPQITARGVLDWDVSESIVRTPTKFLNETGLPKGYRYTSWPPVRLAEAGWMEDYESPFFCLEAPEVTVGGVVMKKYYLSESPPSKPTDGQWCPAASLSLEQDQLAIILKGDMNHLVALGSFIPGTNAEPTLSAPLTDWRNGFLTAAYETNQYVRVEGTFPGVDQSRVLFIEMGDDAALWWVAPGTVVGIAADGSTVRVLEEGGWITRDDRPRLGAVLDAAMVWYSRPRQTLKVSMKGLGGLPAVGTMIGDVQTVTERQGAWTVVTQRAWDFQRDTVSIQTGYAELDFSAIVGTRSKSRGANGAGLSGVAADAAQMQGTRGLEKVTVRQPVASGGTVSGASGDTVTQTAITGFLGFLSGA